MVIAEIRPLIQELDETILANLQNIEGIIAFFMPSVENVGSQIQIGSLSEKYDYIRSLGWELIIISGDDKVTLESFKSKFQTPYRLCSLNNKKILKGLNLYGEIGAIKRTTILFNKSLEIIKRFYEVIPGSHHNHVIDWIENNPVQQNELNNFDSSSGLEEA